MFISLRPSTYIMGSNVNLGSFGVTDVRRSFSLRARSQIPVFGVTGRAPGWPGALKLPAVKQTYKYYTPERQCVTFFTNFWILIISINTNRFGNRIKQIWQPLLFINGYLRMEYTLFQDFPPKSTDRPPRSRPVRPFTGIWLRALKNAITCPYYIAWPIDSCIYISLKPSTNVMGSVVKLG